MAPADVGRGGRTPVLDGFTRRGVFGVRELFSGLDDELLERWPHGVSRPFGRASGFDPIDIDRSLPGRRPDATASWYRSMYVCHVFDHPFRARPRERGSLSLQDHLRFMAALR